jgi:hypothetical protein
VKRRWTALGAGVVALALAAAAPIAAVELGCRAPVPGFDAARPFRAVLPERRPEARTWLTYPEWHIVYAADNLARYLGAGGRPSRYPYGTDIAGFWSSLCTINRVARARSGTGEAKLMLYTIGLSFSVELGVKALYERTIGAGAEMLGGWRSADDAYAARVQADYGRFMHTVPWYAFPFGSALAGAWRTKGAGLRHYERRFALNAEYIAKGGYARAIGAATGASFAPDATTMRIVVAGAAPPGTRVVARNARAAVLEVDRYQAFTDLVGRMAARGDVRLVEVAGNDDIFATLLLPAGAGAPFGATLLDLPLSDGRHRVGVTVKVPALLELVRRTRAGGGTLEHVYDY